MASPERIGIWELNRGEVAVAEWGDLGDPPVACLHGAFDHHRMWDEFAPRLAARGHRVMCLDLRGHGESSRLGSGNVFGPVIGDLAHLARRLDTPLGLLGHSLGGAICIQAARDLGDDVGWVVSLDGLGPSDEAFETQIGFSVTGVSEALDFIDTTLDRGLRVFADREAMVAQRSATNPRVPRPWIEHLVEHGALEVPGGWVWHWDPVFRTWLPSGFERDTFLSSLTDITARSLIIVGAEDDTWSDLTPASLDERCALMGNARWLEVEGAGHYLHLEAPDEVERHLVDFLSEDEPRAWRQEAATTRDHRSHVVADRPLDQRRPRFPDTPIRERFDLGSTLSGDAVSGDAVSGDAVSLLVLEAQSLPTRASIWVESFAPVWPGRVAVPSLPGHGTTPLLEGANPDPLDHLMVALAHLGRAEVAPSRHGDVPLVVFGVATSSWGALLLGLTGRADAVVTLDGLGGPFTPVLSEPGGDHSLAPHDLRRGVEQWLHDRPELLHGPRGPDPRLEYLGPPMPLRHWVERTLDALTIPLLAISTGQGTADPRDLSELTARAAQGHFLELDRPDATLLARAITEWAGTSLDLDRTDEPS